MAKVSFAMPQSALKTSFAAGYYHLPDVKIMHEQVECLPIHRSIPILEISLQML